MATSPCENWALLARMSERVGGFLEDGDRSGHVEDKQ